MPFSPAIRPSEQGGQDGSIFPGSHGQGLDLAILAGPGRTAVRAGALDRGTAGGQTVGTAGTDPSSGEATSRRLLRSVGQTAGTNALGLSELHPPKPILVPTVGFCPVVLKILPEKPTGYARSFSKIVRIN